MNARIIAVAAAIFIVVMTGCSGNNSNPFTPEFSDLTGLSNSNSKHSQTHLWGYYQINIDTLNKTVSIIPLRGPLFTVNVVTFLNGKPDNLKLNNLVTKATTDYIDVGVDVGITHPFPGMATYNGYDVRGVFIGNGSASMDYNSDLIYSVLGKDQTMLADPDNGTGAPDGYTRWFNPVEFQNPGIFGYTKGKLATPKYTGTATLCPYKYFADNLGLNENLWGFLKAGGTNHGVFSAGTINWRRYYIRFPVPNPNVVFNYAVLANWEGENVHPSNAVEAIACSVDNYSTVWFKDTDNKGGKLNLDISLWDWDSKVSAGVMEDYKIFIQSTVLSSVYELKPSEMIPVGGGENFSTYRVEILADNITSNKNNEFWVIAECANKNYKNDFGIPNWADTDPLAAFFRFDLKVPETPYEEPPICGLEVVTPMPKKSWFPIPVEFDASGTFSPNPGGSIVSYEWDFDGDLIFNEPVDDKIDSGNNIKPVHIYAASYSGKVNMRATDNQGIKKICDTIPLSVTVVTNCGTMACPSDEPASFIGTNRLYHFNPEGTRAANPARVICAYSANYQWSALNATGGVTAYFVTDNQTAGINYAIYNVACTSTDRLYYNDSGSMNQVLYCQFDNVNGFTQLRTPFGSPLPSGYFIWRLVVDENDNPIVLARASSTNCKVFRWMGTGWNAGITVPSAVINNAGSYSNINDFDYDPTFGYFLFTNRNGAPAIFAVNGEGNVVWSDIDIWSGNAFNYQIGVEVPVGEPECRIIVMAGYNAPNMISYWARYSPNGAQKTTGTVGDPGYTFNMFDGRGGIVKKGNIYRFFSATFGGNVWAYIDLPDY